MVCFRDIDFYIRIPGITWKLLISRMILMEIALGIKSMTKCPVHQMQGMLNLDEFTDTYRGSSMCKVQSQIQYPSSFALDLLCYFRAFKSKQEGDLYFQDQQQAEYDCLFLES